MKYLITITILFTSTFSFSQEIDTDYSKNKKRIIKIELFSPLTGNTTFGYESYIKDWLSWEAKVGIIGLGYDIDSQAGFLIRGGPKFKLNPDFVTDDLKGSHLLGGKYIRPEIAFSTYREDIEIGGFATTERKNITSVAFLITYGRQYILSNIMTLDYHVGLGYGWHNGNDDKYNYSHINGESDFPIAISAGFTIGVLL